MRAERAAIVAALVALAGCVAEASAPTLSPDVVLASRSASTTFHVGGLAPGAFLVTRDGALVLAPDFAAALGGVPTRAVFADGTGVDVVLPAALAVGTYDLDVLARGRHWRVAGALRVVDVLPPEAGIADGAVVPDAAGLDAAVGSDAGAPRLVLCIRALPCTCSGSRPCRVSCIAGGCDVTCSGDAPCDVTCAAGGCTVHGTGNAAATLSCAGGGCSMDCTGSSTCALTCASGGAMTCSAMCSASCP